MRVILFSVAVLASCAPAAGVQPSPAPASAASPSPLPPGASASPAAKPVSALIPPGDAKPGDRSLCLVSDEEFVVKQSSPKVEHGGKTYYFCCAGCDTDFAKDPERYLKKLK